MAKILLVEDNDMSLDMLRRRLEKRRFEVCVAADGNEAIAKAGEERPDIILMDLSLPVMDGWEACRRLKADAATGEIPIIALTAHVMPADEEKAKEAGCDDFDIKPVHLPRLLEKIEALLGNRAG